MVKKDREVERKSAFQAGGTAWTKKEAEEFKELKTLGRDRR